MDIDLLNEPLGDGDDGPVYLSDIWPTAEEIDQTIASSIDGAMFKRSYGDVYAGDERWRSLEIPSGNLYDWQETSTYVRRAALLRRDAGAAPESGGHRRCSGARHARRLRHDRPHLARRGDPAGLTGRDVPDRARRSTGASSTRTVLAAATT